MPTTRSWTAVAALLALLAAAASPAQPTPDPDAQTGLEHGKYGDPTALATVYFALGSARLTPLATGWLDDSVERLSKSDDPVTVGGHTDALGESKLNQSLSEARAKAVRTYLIAHGIAAERLTAVGYGKSQPVASNETEEGRAHNRRVDLKTGTPPG
jgi:OOP family OmpA-OmpF porin